MDVKIRNIAANLTLDADGLLVMITAGKIICEEGGEPPEDTLARAQYFADPTNAYGTPLMVQFSFGQPGDPKTIADGVLAALGY